MKLLLFVGIAVAVYWLVVKPFLLRPSRQKSTEREALENIFNLYNQHTAAGRQQQPPPHKRAPNEDEDGFTEYEEVKKE